MFDKYVISKQYYLPMEHFRGIFCPVMVAISSGSDINVLEHKQVQNDQESNYCEFFKEWREVKKSIGLHLRS